jgi:multiple sugar transport system substrate-binding protein
MFDSYSRRSFWAGATACAALAAFDGRAQTAKRRTRPSGRVSLKLVTGDDPTGARQTLVAAWNEANPQTQVAYEPLKLNAWDQYQTMKAYAKNGGADILNLDIVNIPEFAANGWLVSVDPERVADFLARPLASCRYKNSYYALPFNSDVGMLFCARDAEITDLNTLLLSSANRWIAQLDDSKADSGEAFVCNVLEHAIAIDPGLLGGTPGNPRYLFENHNAGRWNEALSPLRGAIAANRVIRASGEDDSNSRFANREAPYLRNWPVNYQKLTPGVPGPAGLSITQLGSGVLGGQNLAVLRGCAHQSEAKKVIAFLTSHLAQTILASHGFIPTVVHVYGSSDPLAKLVPHLGNVRGAIENSFARPRTRKYAEFSREFLDIARDFLLNGKNFTVGAMENLRSKIEE